MGCSRAEAGWHRGGLGGASHTHCCTTSVEYDQLGLDSYCILSDVTLDTVQSSAMQNIKVHCLIACLDDSGTHPLLAAAKDAMDASCKLPAGYDSPWPQLVLATLDINQGQLR